jgi:micrococcal nuclease
LVTFAVLGNLVAIAQDTFLCTRVVDGDTIIIEMNGYGEKVRLIGVDTPETVHPLKPVEHFGKEASEFTRKSAEGKNVRLEYDLQKRDKYGRLLAYVYLENGTFLNAEIIKQGYGFAYTKYPFKYMEEFRKHESSARTNRKGLWK